MVTSTHFYRQFHSLSSSVPFSFSVTSIYHNRFHSLRLSPPVFLLLISFGVPHFERTGSQTRHKASSALQELGAREDQNHIHRRRNLKVDKTQPVKTILTALRQGLIRVVAAVVFRVTGPFRLDTVAVRTFELRVSTRMGCH